mgnify:CR=1 FL=1
MRSSATNYMGITTGLLRILLLRFQRAIGRVATVALMLSFCLLGGDGRATAAEMEIGVVKSVKGSAVIERGNGKMNIIVGQALRIGDRISTAPDSAVGFTLQDGSRFSIGPNSAIIVSNFQFEPDRGLLALIARLLYGTMAHASGEIGRIKPQAVQIGTPLGSVGVRGTRFAIRQPGGPAPVQP